MIENVTCTDDPQHQQVSGPRQAGSGTPDSAQLIDDIYETIETPDYWETALATLARVAGARRAALVVHDRRKNHGQIAYAYRIAEPFRRNYQSMFARADPWLAAYEKGLEFGRVIPGEDIISTTRLRNSYFYREFLRPLEVLHTAHAGISNERETETHLLLGRPADDSPFDSADICNVQPYVPHVRRAWRLGDCRTRTESLSRHALLALNRLTIGVVILDSNKHILAMNREAAHLIETVEALSIVQDELEIGTAGRNGTKSPPRPDETHNAASFQILPILRESGRGPIAVLTYPVSEPAITPRTAGIGSLVFISDPYRQCERFDAAMVRRLYAMTPAEARMASRMADGNSLNHIAQELGISIHTARTHLKRIFEKTGVQRQAELVHVLQNTFGFLRPACQRTDKRQPD